MERTFKTEGIILKRTNFGEADKLLTVLTKHYGKLRVRAPGIRKITSRKSPHLELFNFASLLLIQGRNLDIVTEATTVNNFLGIRKNLQKVSESYYICELADTLCPEKQENREIFELVCQALKSIEEGSLNRENFTCQFLWTLGFLPRERKLQGAALQNFIENIIERRLKSPQLLRKTNG